jgi:hypothetical protein
MTTRQASSLVLSIATALALCGCGVAAATVTATPTPVATVTQTGPPGGDKVGPNGQLYSEAAAQARAAKDVALVHLPAGARLQHTPVPAPLLHETEDLGALTGVVTHWWKVPGKAAAVENYLGTHPPKGLIGGISTPNIHGETVSDYGFPSGVKQPRTQVSVSVAQDGGHVDVRVQAFVVWTPTRTAVETIPASVTSARVVYQPLNLDETLGKKRAVTVTGANLRLIVRTLNKLEASSTLEHSCPGNAVDSVTISVSYGTHRLTFAANGGGCGIGVEVTADGVPQPALARPDLLLAAVHKVLHVTKAEDPTLGT